MKHRGFTLIELLVVIFIIALLTAIAIPSYRQYALRSARAQAKADLMQVAQALERQFTVDRSYLTYTLDAVSARSPRTGGAARYTISLAARDRTSFTLQAAPLGSRKPVRAARRQAIAGSHPRRGGARPARRRHRTASAMPAIAVSTTRSISSVVIAYGGMK